MFKGVKKHPEIHELNNISKIQYLTYAPTLPPTVCRNKYYKEYDYKKQFQIFHIYQNI
jgi:hypothetical protein